MKHFITTTLLLALLSQSSIYSQCIANAGPDKTICPSPGSVQIGGTAQLQTTYSWAPVTGLNNPSISNPKASPVTTTTYTLTTSTNLIANGNFEQGNTGFSSDYTAILTNYQGGDGTYTIGSNPNNYTGHWCNKTNHTPGGTQMMIIDGLNNFQTNDNFWKQNVRVQPNSVYNFSAWFLSNSDANYNPLWPIIQVKVNGIVVINNFTLQYNRCSWVNLNIPIAVGNNTSVLIEMQTITYIGTPLGNDFAVDDIEMLCTSTDDVTVTVPLPLQLTGYFDGGSGCPGNFKPIVPYANNYYCWGGDCGIATFLESNYPSGNEWYINDIQITGTGNIPGIGYVNILNNTKNITLYRTTSTTTQQFKLQVKNTSQGCTQLTLPTYTYAALRPGSYMGAYKSNFTKTYYTYPYNSAGPGSIYTWSVPNTTVTDIDPFTPEATIYFPQNISHTGVNGTITITNSPYCNGTYNINFNYDPGASKTDSFTEIESFNKAVIYPNPTSNQITITSNEPISYIEISDLMNPTLKKIKVNGTKSVIINVFDLNPGVYNCKITTSKGVENQKLIIKR
jgi:Secretion system C-terminal sorting domain